MNRKNSFISKNVKIMILIILSILLTFCVGFLVFPAFTTYAEIVDVPSENLNDNINSEGESGGNQAFAFEQGASIRLMNIDGTNAFSERDFKLDFKLSLIDPDHEHLLKFTTNKDDAGVFGSNGLIKDVFNYYFTVYRSVGQGQAIPLKQVAVGLCYVGTTSDYRLMKAVATKKLVSSYDEEIEYTNIADYFAGANVDINDTSTYPSGYTKLNYNGVPLFREANNNKFDAQVKARIDAMIDAGYNVEHVGIFTNGGLFYPSFDTGVFNGVEAATFLTIKPESPTTEYFIKFDYKYEICTKDTIFVTEYGTPEHCKGWCRSDIRSIYSILSNMNDAGVLEEVFNEEELAVANDVLYNEAKQQVKIRYLEQIGDIPFAVMKEKYVNVPVTNGNSIYPVDVYNVLGVESLDVLNSEFYRFDYISDGLYQAYYLENVWLRAKTTDGHDFDYFLDINKSYEEFYKPFVEAGAMSQELYEYHFSGFHSKYDELEGYLMSEVYSYYGLAIIPDGFNFDRAFADMFGISPHTAGIISTFNYSDNLSYESYKKLMDEYNYGWLDKWWATLASVLDGGTYPAEYYVFYCDGLTRETLIGEGGQEDSEDGGVIKEETSEILDEVGGFFSSFFGISTSLGKIISVVLVVSFVLFIFYKLKKKKRK